MTDADKRAFAAAIDGLCHALREKELDAVQKRIYFMALRDLDIELVVAATERIAQRRLNEKGEAWFPKAPEWRAAVERIEMERQAIQTARIRERMKLGAAPLCGQCEDTGWARDAQNRASRCECRNLRRLEILGRRPMPALPEAR